MILAVLSRANIPGLVWLKYLVEDDRLCLELLMGDKSFKNHSHIHSLNPEH